MSLRRIDPIRHLYLTELATVAEFARGKTFTPPGIRQRFDGRETRIRMSLAAASSQWAVFPRSAVATAFHRLCLENGPSRQGPGPARRSRISRPVRGRNRYPSALAA